MIQEPLNETAPEDVLFDYRLDITGLDSRVKCLARIHYHDWALFTEAKATCASHLNLTVQVVLIQLLA
jgi:hypothetical protein